MDPSRRRFILLFVPRHELPEILACGMAVLADQHDSSVGENRQYDDRTRVHNDFARRYDPARLCNTIALEREHTAPKQHLAGEDSGSLGPAALSILHARSLLAPPRQFYRTLPACQALCLRAAIGGVPGGGSVSFCYTRPRRIR